MEVLNMAFDTVKSTVGTAVDTLSTVAQSFVEKNRTKAKLNRLRMVMKNESELMNRAYIALGKEYYEVLKKGDVEATDKQEKLLEVIDSCKAKIARARNCYREIIESQNEFLYSAPAGNEQIDCAEVVDITVACSNESDYSSSPFEHAGEAAEEKAEEVKEAAENAKEAVAEKAVSIREAVAEKAETIRETVAEKAEVIKDAVEDKAGDIKDSVAKKAKKAKAVKNSVHQAVKEALDEEYPEDELF